MSDASAIVPRPVTESLKICRRVLALRISSRGFIGRLRVSDGGSIRVRISRPMGAWRVQPLVRVSSRFRSTLVTIVQAASSAFRGRHRESAMALAAGPREAMALAAAGSRR